MNGSEQIGAFDAALRREYGGMAAEYDRLIGLFEAGGFVFGLTLSPDIFMRAALESAEETEHDIAELLMRKQYPFIARHGDVVKSVTVLDDEPCIVAKGYNRTKADKMRIAYIELDPAALDIEMRKRDGRLALRVAYRDDSSAGFFAVLPSGSLKRKIGTGNFILAYDSFGDFFEGSTAIRYGFTMMLAPDIATYRAIIVAGREKLEKN